ncbi:MAG: hypothetical protein U0S48_13680 [Solirubrobacteraceae bacterium]
MKAAGVMDCGVGVALVTLGSGALNRMQVFDARDGRLIGCLCIVVADGPLEGLLARVSQRVSCTQHIDDDKQWPPGGHRPD